MAEQQRKNNFDALRFWAALTVLWSHAFPLSGQRDPIDILSGGQTSAGRLAVAVFFVISGYFVTASYVRSPDPLRFIRARVLRIFPGLVVVLLVTALVAGPLLTTLTAGEYFSSPLTYKFVYQNLPFFIDNVWELPGVFVNNIYPKAVNGSLWTMNFECRCYLLVLLLGISGLLGRAAALVLFAVAMVLVILLPRDDGLLWHTADLTAIFLAGSILFLCDIRARSMLMVTAVAAIVGSAYLKWQLPAVLASAGVYFIACVGLSPQIRMPYLSRFGDLSYGIYLYAFPVQQIVTQALGPWATWYLNAGISTPIVIGLAGLSWRYVEGPALALKKDSRPASIGTAAPSTPG